MNFEYWTEEEKGVWLFQQCGTCARGRIHRPTSEHIILSHPNNWGKEEVVSLPIQLTFLGTSYSTWTWHSSVQRDIPVCHMEYLFTACAHHSICLGYTFPSLRPSVSRFRVSLLFISQFLLVSIIIFLLFYTFILLPTFLLFFYL
jgi:hypothetical protein